ncbi:MAG: hypothetical protein AAGU05_09210, partial [Anaerolineaceae bacterium]
MPTIALVCTLHDPHATMLEQARRVLPALNRIFGQVCIRASQNTHPNTLGLLGSAGAYVDSSPAPAGDGEKLGLARGQAVALGLQCGADVLLYCDFDRAIHWGETFPDELVGTAEQIQGHDFTVLGRTPRAW